MIGKGVTNIGNNAFAGCSGLRQINVTANVTDIGETAFTYCSSLTWIAVDPDNSAFSAYQGVLFNKDRTKVIQFPAGRTDNCYTLPAAVTRIGASSFAGCVGLKSVTVPDTVTEIGDKAFFGCASLLDVFFDGNAPALAGESVFAESDNVIIYFLSDTTGWDSAYGGRLTAPFPFGYTDVEGAVTVTTYTGAGGSVIIPDTIRGSPVMSIGNNAFIFCMSLSNIVISANVTHIGVQAFWNCMLLAHVVLPDSIVSVGDSAFKGCSSLTDIAIPNGMRTIGNSAFESCSNLKDVVVPDSVVSLGDSAFSRCGITNVVIGANITSLGRLIFASCPLASVEIPFGVTNIGFAAFFRCVNLSRISIPNSVTQVDSFAFQGCVKLTGVTIPASVQMISGVAFFDCSGLTRVLFTGDVPTLLNGNDFTGGENMTVYYLPGRLGWANVFGGKPAVCWNPRFEGPCRFGSQSSGFSFTVTGNQQIPVGIDFATKLTAPAWVPLVTDTLGSSGVLSISDPDAPDHPARFYRIRWP